MNGRTAIVSNSRLVEFAGSEITTMEIADTLASLGMSVTVAAYEFGAEFIKEIEERGHTLLNLRAASELELNVDLAWIHHATTYYALIAAHNMRARRIVSSSLSFFEPIESPPIALCGIDRFLVNSQESHGHFVSHYPQYADRCVIFPNAAAPKFWNAFDPHRTETLRRVAVVSNHVAAEVAGLVDLLRMNGVTVDVYGIGAIVTRITPDLLAQYDSVVSIGKTVQYCIAAGIPVFCYDHFAGPGWITSDSFDSARQANFSGRSHPSKRPPGLLYSEFRSGFARAYADRIELRERGKALFDLSANVRNLLDSIEASGGPIAHMELTETHRNLISRHVDMVLRPRDMLSHVQHVKDDVEHRLIEIEAKFAKARDERDRAKEAMTTLESDVHRLTWALSEETQRRERVEQKLDALYRSTSWRLTKPVRLLKQGGVRTRTHLAWGKFLVGRGVQVARHQGVGELSRRTARYVRAVVRSKLASAKSLETATSRSAEQPLVSFVIPIYDRTDVLREAILSALAQTVTSFEVLLITDGSPPATLAVVNEFADHPRVRIFHFPVSSGNAVRGRNKGILEARGKYIAFLDSDDVAAHDRLEKTLPLLESGIADVVYGAWRARLDGSREIEGISDQQIVYSPDADLELLKQVCVPCQSTVTVRRDILLKCGFLKPHMEYREDHELWARIAYFGGVFKSLPSVLVDLRLHAGNNELNFKNEDAVYGERLREQFSQRGPIPKKIAFILPGVGISGGVAVVFRHASMLMKAGHDVTIINIGLEGDGKWFSGNTAPIVHVSDRRKYLFDGIDMLIATGWQTAEWLSRIPAKRLLYFVQSDERRFYEEDALKRKIEATYRIECEYFTEAHWIRAMLRDEFGHESAYVPNGLDPVLFHPDVPLEPKAAGGRLRVLLEGPIIIPFKGMADAYAAVESLDCEIWIISSAGKPPANWRCDRFFEAVEMNQMRHIYSACDIFIKMSRVEGFFGPPMEAMACGCSVVVGKVTGWDEYIVHEGNALVVEQGDIEGAKIAVKRLLDDPDLRARLIEGGKKTASEWTWEKSGKAMLEVVDAPVTGTSDVVSN
ncbi:glycosyltransferase [Burkholderia multivorans]|uniref:glycosyltransferase n=1 Tax=Burkholderia multivorans TaxID=87883 RepID=UPI001C22F036|nr:glycosyltransferase [Burkholderia multivorans]MBU9662039.1 glycosyltransferase [Burkholderia multivorans]